MRFAFLLVSLFVLGCRTTSGLDERASAILADYRTRTAGSTPDGDRTAWAVGQFTVHLWTSGERNWLERIAVTELRTGKIRLALDRLGAGTQLRVTATLLDQPRNRAALDQLLTDAWVREGDRPEIHHAGSVPRWVADAVFNAIERPTGTSAATLRTPAGAFPETSGGSHPSVPLSGVVRLERSGSTRELLEYGDDGGGALY